MMCLIDSEYDSKHKLTHRTVFSHEVLAAAGFMAQELVDGQGIMQHLLG